MTTPEIVQLLSFGLTDAALVVFSISMFKYVNRRDVVVAQSVASLSKRLDLVQDRFVDVLSKLADSFVASSASHVDANKSLVAAAKESHQSIVDTLAALESNHSEAHSALLEGHKINAATHEKIQEASVKASEIVAQTARVSVAATHGRNLKKRNNG